MSDPLAPLAGYGADKDDHRSITACGIRLGDLLKNVHKRMFDVYIQAQYRA